MATISNTVHISVCASCQSRGSDLAQEIRTALEEGCVAAQVNAIDCMSGCAKPTTVAFRSTGKAAYLFGGITSADISDILRFVMLYEQSIDGNFADARPLGSLRLKALARIPG